MIYPFDAAYGQQVLRVHYEYADMLPAASEKLSAKTSGLIAHDRFLAKWDGKAGSQHIRRRALDRYGLLIKNPR